MSYGIDRALLDFAFYYPLMMAYFWMIGGVYYYFHWERGEPLPDSPPVLPRYPFASILIPCHNEGPLVEETMHYALAQRYPSFEVIAIDDGSSDGSGAVLDRLASEHSRLRVVHLSENQGKAAALRAGAMLARGEFLTCIDGDAALEAHALTWIMRHFVNGSRVGAVTGNPRIRNRSTLLGRVQVGEFSSIIGLIKRAQRVYGRLFTVSGVLVAFRRSALHRVGYWSTDQVTEDIDVSWKLQLDHWDVRFEPNALGWILMPETFRGLLRQRVRWAQGGAEVLLKYAPKMTSWRMRRMWPVCLELFASIFWSYLMLAIAALWLVGKFAPLPSSLTVSSIVPGWNGVVLGVTCLLQFSVSLLIDARYERGLARHLFWIVWYPMAYWVLNVLATVIGLPRALLKPRGTRARWVSPDRGVVADAAADHRAT